MLKACGNLILIRPSACVPGANKIALQTKPEISSATTLTITNPNNLKCYPNPFSQKFTIEFDLVKEDEASIKLYDLNGKQLKLISSSFFTKGSHQLLADASGLPAGFYIVVLQTTRFKKEQKVIKIN